MTSTSAYETLYNNMKKHFTVISDNNEYTLGEYMSMKAEAKSEAATKLPAVRSAAADNHSMTAIISYVNEKLTVKKAPVKDKTMRAFPFRTSMAAALSAVVACALIFSYGIFAVNGAGNTPATVDVSEEISECEIYDEVEIKKN